jgi:hypothetical protein
VTASAGRLEFLPSTLDLQLGQTAAVRLFRIGARGERVDVTTNPEVAYRVSGPDVPFEFFAGRITATQPGRGVLLAQLGGATAQLEVFVRAPVIELRIEPDPVVVPLNGIGAFRVFATDGNGEVTDVTEDPELLVQTIDPGVATLVQAGLLLGLRPDTTILFAEYRTVAARVRVSVTDVGGASLAIRIPPQLPVGVPTPFSVLRTEANGRITDVTNDPALGLGLDPPFALTLSSPGVLIGQVPGPAIITATLDGLVAQTVVEVVGNIPRAIALEFVPAQLDLAPGATAGVELFARFDDGTRDEVTLDPRANYLARGPIDTALDTAAGVFSVRGRATGAGTVVATFDGQTALLRVDVTPQLVALEVTPNPARVVVGGTRQLAVVGLFDDGSRAPVSNLTFTSLAIGTARVSGSGLVTGVALGNTTVRVTRGAITTDVSVEVTQPLPTLTSVLPDAIVVGSSDTPIVLVGTNFLSGDDARVDGLPIPTQFVDARTLAATIPASLLRQSGTLSVDVAGTRGASNARRITVGAPPRITSASPNALILGSSLPFTIVGEGLAGAVASSAGLTLTPDGGAVDGTWTRWIIGAAPNAMPGPRTITLTTAFGSTTFAIELVDPLTLNDLTVTTGQTITLSGTQRVRSLRVERGARIQVIGREPLVILASRDIDISGELFANGADGGRNGTTRGGGSDGGGGGGGGGGDGQSMMPTRGGTGTPDGAPGLPAVAGQSFGGGGSGGGSTAGTGAGNICAGGGGGGFAGSGGNGAGLIAGVGGAADGLGSGVRGGTGGGGGASCLAFSGGGGGGGGGVIVLQAARGGRLRVTATGVVSADGGAGGAGAIGGLTGGGGGGGGSGGRIELLAPGGLVDVGGTVRARGGNGGTGNGAAGGGGAGGGGGSGGSVLIDTRAGGMLGRTQVDVSGGLGAGLGRAGSPGVTRVF